ncbi:MAG: sensor histidine kinase [Clostridia bacterium]
MLSKEENLTPEVRDYVNILIQKSNRLKNIVTDLFELARTTSGNAEIHQEQLSVKKLLIQTMGDMEDRIESAGIPIKASISDEPMRIVADGNKMYRVLQNLLDNALKYSMVGTRIFLSLEPRGGNAVIAIKNTASYEMDFSAEEIVERFTRGDKARTSEGSGLGLAIAESFVAAME